MDTFADRLRYARTARRLTQAELARASGLSQSAIANYENGSRRSTKTIFRLADALHVSAQWLAEGRGDMETPSYAKPSAPSRAARLSDRKPTHTNWPFQRVSPEAFWALDDDARSLIEETVATLVGSLGK